MGSALISSIQCVIRTGAMFHKGVVGVVTAAARAGGAGDEGLKVKEEEENADDFFEMTITKKRFQLPRSYQLISIVEHVKFGGRGVAIH